MTTYELPPEPPIGESVRDVHGRTWKHEGVNRWALNDVDPAYRETRSWQQLFLSHPLTLIEPDPWPTAPLIVADWSEDNGNKSDRSVLYIDAVGNYCPTIDDEVGIVRGTRDTLANVIPVTVVPAAALPVLWSALEQWLNNGLATFTEDMHRLVGAVESLRGQIDALGVDL
jgi:hypothetical protein